MSDPDPATPGSTDDVPRAGSARWSWLVLLVVVAGSVVLVRRNADGVAETIELIGGGPMAVAALLSFAGTFAVGAIWLCLMRGLDAAQVPAVDGLCTFYVAQLGKYVPGAVWPILAQLTAARRWGCRKSSVVSANLIMLLLLAATGTALGLVLLPWVAGIGRPWLAWASLAVPVLLAVLHPAFLPWVTQRIRIPERWRADVVVAERPWWRAVAAALVTWLMLGGQVWVLLHAAGAHGVDAMAAALGGVGLAWAVGLVVVVAPAGAGAREAVLVAVLAPLVGGPAALTIALASRLLLTLTDVVLALAGAVVRTARGQGEGSVPPPVQQ